jgi:hypothetical protein
VVVVKRSLVVLGEGLVDELMGDTSDERGRGFF